MQLKVNNISKTIRRKKILDSVSMDLYGGKVYVICGPNGCGKTMLFRALSGLMSLDSGTVELDGKILRKDFSVLPSLGIVLENVNLYANLTGFQNLQYLAELKGLIGESEIRNALRRVGLDPEDRRTYKKYSLGMKQRLAIAQAIMESPDIIMLDEPTNALDREGAARIRELIMEEKNRGTLVLIATHNDEDVRILADGIFEMESGQITDYKAGSAGIAGFLSEDRIPNSQSLRG